MPNVLDVKEITVERLQSEFSADSGYAAIHWAENQYGDYPRPPKKPTPPTKGVGQLSSEELKSFTKEVESYEAAYEEYKIKRDAYQERENQIQSVITEYIKQESGLYSIPEKYQSRVWNLAYDTGHSDGFHTVFDQLCKFVSIFDL